VRTNFQFIDLGDHSQVSIEKRAHRLDSASRIKYCTFTFPADREDKEEKRSFVRDRRICEQIAERLRADGFDVSKTRRGKPRGAVLNVKFDGFDVTIILDANRLKRSVKCNVLTWTHASRWRRVSPELVADEWARTRKALEKVLRRDREASSLSWLTEDELAGQDKISDSELPSSTA
jgi:hypothetical protein